MHFLGLRAVIFERKSEVTSGRFAGLAGVVEQQSRDLLKISTF